MSEREGDPDGDGEPEDERDGEPTDDGDGDGDGDGQTSDGDGRTAGLLAGDGRPITSAVPRTTNSSTRVAAPISHRFARPGGSPGIDEARTGERSSNGADRAPTG